ncbi:hypothetical protein ABWH96_12985 [Marivirga tractuosa]|uniref:hypothetical protein n=1 Tax=Marivirga tractuosa TaxID=1006 RepID=UPI0035D0AE80
MINTTNLQNQIIFARRGRAGGQKVGQRWYVAMKHLFVPERSGQKGKVETTKYNFGYKSRFNI